MSLRALVLGVGLAVGLGACVAESENSWGKRSGCHFTHYDRGFTLDVQEFEKAILAYSKADSSPPICMATVMYKDSPKMVLEDINDFHAENKKEFPLGDSRIVFDKSVLGYTIGDSNCDGKAEVYVNNRFKGVQEAVARDERPELFEGELDSLLAEVEVGAKDESKKRSNGFSRKDLIIFIISG